MADNITSWYYGDDDFKTFLGYRLSAIDGSILELNNSERLRNAYGYAEGKTVSHRIKMMDEISLEIIEINDEVTALAEKYISEGVFSSKYLDDATHVAAASVLGCTAIVSWNFKHIVKLKTILGVNGINRFMGYGEIEIITPEIIVEEEGEENEGI